MSILYRVENPSTMQGLWYRGDGTFNPFIRSLGDAKCHDLPMDFDPAFKAEGLDWFSACDNTEDMSNWFSLSDLQKLHMQGYRLYRFEVTRYRNLGGHAVFARHHVVSAKAVPINLICAEWEGKP